ncbi:MAG: DNA mismatch repair protein [Lachnospiraceae bacterium]|nr:DNA mismatch repair protein [Lachnospiraceae bacterium]
MNVTQINDIARNLSLLQPAGSEASYRELSDVTLHDLGIDSIVKKIATKASEQEMIKRVLGRMTADRDVAAYRSEVFEDIYRYPALRDRMVELLDKIDFLRDYGSFRTDYDGAASTWDLLHRLEEINEYIQCVEAIHDCLTDVDIKSRGLIRLRDYIDVLYNDNGFGELKKDIAGLKASTENLKSVTLGINLNDRFEAVGIGLISINSKPFTKAKLLSGFYDKITGRDSVNEGNDWNEDYHFQPVQVEDLKAVQLMDKANMYSVLAMQPLLAAGVAGVPSGDSSADVMRYMDRIANHMLSITVKKLRETLAEHVTVSIQYITRLIPEFMYYIRWAEYIDDLVARGMKFSGAVVAGEDHKHEMKAKGIYNLKLASVYTEQHEEIITNDLDFDADHLVYILTGANRGGKTTITQAVGILFVMAQGGIYVPGDGFEFTPVDAIYTHFPADEDKTMDLGRLGEECKRFKEIYKEATEDSLLLLNETFSTTSFEEGYYIACDAVRAILSKGIRTIYNTHMHKLGYDIDELNSDIKSGYKASSLIVEAKEGKRSYKVKVAPPEGMSYAHDIAVKYGVTLEMLMGDE